MTRRPLLLVPALLLPLLLVGCSGLQGTGDLEYVQGSGAVLEIEPADREAPVEVSGEQLEGDGTLDLASLRGQVVVVNVWWSGCIPCRTEMPMLVDLAEQADPADVRYTGINIRDASEDDALSFEGEFGVQYPSIYDPSSETLLDFGRYSPTSPPSTLVLDREGRVAALINGAIPSEQTLTDVVDDVVAEDGGGA